MGSHWCKEVNNTVQANSVWHMVLQKSKFTASPEIDWICWCFYRVLRYVLSYCAPLFPNSAWNDDRAAWVCNFMQVWQCLVKTLIGGPNVFSHIWLMFPVWLCFATSETDGLQIWTPWLNSGSALLLFGPVRWDSVWYLLKVAIWNVQCEYPMIKYNME